MQFNELLLTMSSSLMMSIAKYRHTKAMESKQKYYTSTGQYFGYPPCCIQEFIVDTANKQARTPERELAGAKTGFIPCHQHAKEVLAGNMALHEVILPTRQHAKPFLRPNKKSILK